MKKARKPRAKTANKRVKKAASDEEVKSADGKEVDQVEEKKEKKERKKKVKVDPLEELIAARTKKPTEKETVE